MVESALGFWEIVLRAKFWIILVKIMVAERANEKRVLRVRVESLSGDGVGIWGVLQGIVGEGETEAKGVNLGVLVLGFEGLMARERGGKLGLEVKVGALGFRGGR